MSVTLAHVISSRPEDVLSAFPGFALASLSAGLARSCQQGVAREPTQEEPAHAVVFGSKPRSVRDELAKGSSWVIAPPTGNF